MSSPGAGASPAMASRERPSSAPTSRIWIPGPMISTMSGSTSTLGAFPIVIMPTSIVMPTSLSLEDTRVGRGPAGPHARAGIEADLPQLLGLELCPLLGSQHVADGLALVHHLRDGGGHHVVRLSVGLETHALRPEGHRHRGSRPARCRRRAHPRLTPCHLVPAEDTRGKQIGVADEAGHEDG